MINKTNRLSIVVVLFFAIAIIFGSGIFSGSFFVNKVFATPTNWYNGSVTPDSFAAGSVSTLTGTIIIVGTEVSDEGDGGCQSNGGFYIAAAYMTSAGWKLKSGLNEISSGSASITSIDYGSREPFCYGQNGGGYTPSTTRVDFSINVSGLAVGSYNVNITGVEQADLMKGWSQIFDINPSLTFTVTVPSYTLSTFKNGSGTGIITSNPTGINFGSTSSASFGENTSVTLGATADSGSYFDGWSGDCNPSGVVVMSANKSCTATFTLNAVPTGIVTVSSNQPTQWIVNGPTLSSGSGTSGSYTSNPGTYNVTADDLACFSKSISPSSDYLASGATIVFNITYTPNCSGTIIVTSNLSTHWTLTRSGSVVYEDTNTTKTYSGAAIGTYTIAVDTKSGYTYAITPAVTQSLANGETKSFLITYTLIPPVTKNLSVTVNGSGTVTSNPSGINCSSGNCIAPFGVGASVTLTAIPSSSVTWSGACAGTGNCSVTMSQDQSVTATFTALGSITFVVTYTPSVLTAPTITHVDNVSIDHTLACNTIKVYWTATTGTYFTVERSQDDVTYIQVSGNIPNTTHDFTDTNLTPEATYYYKVIAHSGGNTVTSASSGPILNSACGPLMVISTLISVNNSPFSSNIPSQLKKDDKVTFKEVLSNGGNKDAAVNYICETTSSNFTNIRNLQVSGVGSVAGIIVTPGPHCATEFTTHGTKAPDGNNWIITFDTTFTPQNVNTMEVCSNHFVVNYTDINGTSNATSDFGPKLCKKSSGSVPNFQEVAP